MNLRKTTNKRLRQAFSGIHPEYIGEFAQNALNETVKSTNPLSRIFHKETRDVKERYWEYCYIFICGTRYHGSYVNMVAL